MKIIVLIPHRFKVRITDELMKTIKRYQYDAVVGTFGMVCTASGVLLRSSASDDTASGEVSSMSASAVGSLIRERIRQVNIPATDAANWRLYFDTFVWLGGKQDNLILESIEQMSIIKHMIITLSYTGCMNTCCAL